jgi:hypothetical protein
MFCKDCTKKDTCKEICKPLEAYLQSVKSDKEILGIERGCSDRQIRRKEIPYDPEHFEQFLPMLVLEKLWGKESKSFNNYDENAEN